MLAQEEYSDYCNRYNNLWKYLRQSSHSFEEVVYTICELRGYQWNSDMSFELYKTGFVYLDNKKFNADKALSFDNNDMGLLSKDGSFLLNGRFIFPVRDMLGNVIALIGWFPDNKKYITTPSKMFSKKCLFFGLEQLKSSGLNKNYFLVEGIFDAISIRSLGYNCVALMGITASSYTEVLYSLFNRLIAIPDNDSEGRGVIKNDKWRLPTNSSYLSINGGVKDIDELIKNYDVKEILNDSWKEKDRIIQLFI